MNSETSKGKMVMSSYSFSTPHILASSLSANPHYKSSEASDDVTFQDVEFVVNSQKIKEGLSMFLTVRNAGEDEPLGKRNLKYDFQFIMQANFSWKDELSDKEISDFSKTSAVTLIISYARVYLNQITSMGLYGPVQLPFVDVTKIKFE